METRHAFSAETAVTVEQRVSLPALPAWHTPGTEPVQHREVAF